MPSHHPQVYGIIYLVIIVLGFAILKSNQRGTLAIQRQRNMLFPKVTVSKEKKSDANHNVHKYFNFLTFRCMFRVTCAWYELGTQC